MWTGSSWIYGYQNLCFYKEDILYIVRLNLKNLRVVKNKKINLNSSWTQEISLKLQTLRIWSMSFVCDLLWFVFASVNPFIFKNIRIVCDFRCTFSFVSFIVGYLWRYSNIFFREIFSGRSLRLILLNYHITLNRLNIYYISNNSLY